MANQTLLNNLLECEKNIGIINTLFLFYGENITVKIPFSGELCSASLTEYELTRRSLNGLRRSGIFTVGELVDALSKGKLDRALRVGLGQKSIAEIKTKALAIGFANLAEEEKIKFFETLISNNTVNLSRSSPL